VAAEQKRADIVILRPFNHTGPGQTDRFVAPAFAAQIARAEAGLQPPIIRVGNQSPVRDFLDVRDVVRAYLLAFEKARPSIYNICSDQGTQIGDLLKMLLGLARIPCRVVSEEGLHRAGEADIRIGNSSAFRRETGWRPTIPLRKTLSDLLDVERSKCEHPTHT
jgi:GDP-4-dehydro-6-deoxy-D-mannose reductase